MVYYYYIFIHTFYLFKNGKTIIISLFSHFVKNQQNGKKCLITEYIESTQSMIVMIIYKQIEMYLNIYKS